MDGNGSLSQEEIVAVTGILISGIYGEESTAWCETKSLEGIEYFSDMTFLACANLPLTSLDISKNAKLEGLLINNCPVTNLVFNSNLKCLTCERTQLTHLDVSNLELNNLWCADNQLNTLVLSPTLMLMYGKEASNRKQEIDRQHHTIPNQRLKDKHRGNVYNLLFRHGKVRSQNMEKLKCSFPTTP